jgi:hypothetical protein
MRTLVIACVALLAGAAAFVGDDMNVQADPKANFASFRTFTLRDASITSERPELDNRLFEKKLGNTIRAALVERGLKEVQSNPDLIIDYSVTNEDVATTARGNGAGPQPVRYTVGMLVIDMFRLGVPTPVWRGVYRDDERTGSKLVVKLPEDAKKLIAKYPRLSK